MNCVHFLVCDKWVSFENHVLFWNYTYIYFSCLRKNFVPTYKIIFRESYKFLDFILSILTSEIRKSFCSMKLKVWIFPMVSIIFLTMLCFFSLHVSCLLLHPRPLLRSWLLYLNCNLLMENERKLYCFFGFFSDFDLIRHA